MGGATLASWLISALLVLGPSSLLAEDAPQEFGPPDSGLALGLITQKTASLGASIPIWAVIKNVSDRPIAVIPAVGPVRFTVQDSSGNLVPTTEFGLLTPDGTPKCMTTPVTVNIEYDLVIAPGTARVDPLQNDLYCYKFRRGRYTISAKATLWGPRETAGQYFPLATVTSNTITIEISKS